MPHPLSDTDRAPILALVGPTAVGKTAISLAIAERLNAEIISADSRQVYKSLTIGTAKPSPCELERVPHHFVGELGLEECFSAGAFAEKANGRISGIIRSGRTPLIVGGSTLYLQALIHGLSPVPPADASIRMALEARLSGEGSGALLQELKTIDPKSAKTLDPTKTRRLIRSLEVYYQTGNTLSSYLEQRTPPPFHYDVKVLTMNRARLYERIDRRVDQMVAAGLLDEVRSLKTQGYRATLPSLQTIGYQEAFAHLDGEIAETEMLRQVKRNTRRYAKRQLTWFRRYDEQHWIDIDAPNMARLGRWRDAFSGTL